MQENFNLDFTQNLWIDTNQEEWLESPSKQVLRIPLEREGKESGHTTSIVQYEAGARFPQHPHPLGEEILVLDGILSDEQGDYPAGTYLRNPPGSFHTPFSKEGCKLFVKLNQFDSHDKQVVRVDTHATQWLPGQGNLQVMPLHKFGATSTALVKWPAGEKFQPHRHYGGEEIFVLSGEFMDEHGVYPAGSWIRNSHLSSHLPYVKEETVIFVKVGHIGS